MRAREILQEKSYVKTGLKPHSDHEMVIPSAHRVAGTADRTYDLNRVMIHIACADHTGLPHVKVDKESWAGRNNIAIPYTKLESDMLKHAYNYMGAEWDDILHPNFYEKSEEPKDTYKVSPVSDWQKKRLPK